MSQQENAWVRGSWMQTFTGRQFYALDPRPDEVDPIDIAHALSLLCRYNGHVDRFYSVAEHCVLLSYAVSPRNALWALLHDATEAYIGDMVRPLKCHIGQYRLIEARLMGVIAERFTLPGEGLMRGVVPDEVRDADNRILLDERAALMSATRHAWEVDAMSPLGVTVRGWQPAEAEEAYLDRLTELGALIASGET